GSRSVFRKTESETRRKRVGGSGSGGVPLGFKREARRDAAEPPQASYIHSRARWQPGTEQSGKLVGEASRPNRVELPVRMALAGNLVLVGEGFDAVDVRDVVL